MNIRDWLIQCEGLKQFPYFDSVGVQTIGVGRNLRDRGLTIEECHYLLDNDIKRCQKELEAYEWYRIQPPGVRDALVNMCFNLGIGGLLKFQGMIEALKARQYNKASLEALDSKWAKQVKQRANDIAAVIREGR